MHRTALLLVTAATACGRMNTGTYDKLTMDLRSVVVARTPTTLSFFRSDPSRFTDRFRPRTLSCAPACEVEPVLGSSGMAEFLVTFPRTGTYLVEPVVERVADEVLFADEFKVEVLEAGPPKLELLARTGVLQPVAALNLVRGGAALVCASTVIANTTTPIPLAQASVPFRSEPAGVVSLRVDRSSADHPCQKVVAQAHGVARVSASIAGESVTVTVDVVDPARISGFSLVALSGVTAKDLPVGPAREPVTTGLGTRSSVYRLEATTDDQRTVFIEPRCLMLRSGELVAAGAAWSSEPVLTEAFTLSTRSPTTLEWNAQACGPASAPLAIRVVP